MLCDIDDLQLQDEFDKRAALKNENGRNTYSWTKLNDYLEAKGHKRVSRPTIDKHRDHVAHPKDRIVSAIEKRRASGGVQKANVSHDKFLESLVGLGYQKIQDDPDSVTVDQALKAAQIQANREKKGQTQNVLVQLFTGGAEPATVVEGEVKEV